MTQDEINAAIEKFKKEHSELLANSEENVPFEKLDQISGGGFRPKYHLCTKCSNIQEYVGFSFCERCGSSSLYPIF